MYIYIYIYIYKSLLTPIEYFFNPSFHVICLQNTSLTLYLNLKTKQYAANKYLAVAIHETDITVHIDAFRLKWTYYNTSTSLTQLRDPTCLVN